MPLHMVIVFLVLVSIFAIICGTTLMFLCPKKLESSVEKSVCTEGTIPLYNSLMHINDIASLDLGQVDRVCSLGSDLEECRLESLMNVFLLNAGPIYILHLLDSLYNLQSKDQ